MNTPGHSRPFTLEDRVTSLSTSMRVFPLAILLAVALFLSGYGVHRASAQSASAGIPNGQPAPGTQNEQNMAFLEAAVMANPTPANRLNLTSIFIKANQPERALPILMSLVSEDKEDASAWNNLCVVNILRGFYTLASVDCNHAVALEPNNQLARNNLKWAEAEQKKEISALVSVQHTPPPSQEASSYIAQGLRLLKTGLTNAAIASFLRALEIDPANAIAANDIGDAYMLKKQPESALQWFLKASVLDPDLQLARNNMVWAIAEKAKVK